MRVVSLNTHVHFMTDIQLELSGKTRGAFNLLEDGKKIGEMELSIHNGVMTVYHTEVDPEQEGKGYAKKLLDNMVAYAREHKLMVLPLCPYVHAQFKRHPELYTDIWQKEG